MESKTFIKKAEIAREMGVDLKTIDRRIREGVFPPPHSRPGPRIALWRRKYFDQYVDSGTWPPEAFPRHT